MARRRCCGMIDDFPICHKFVPTPSNGKAEITIKFEEIEAIRLKDLEGLDQIECGKSMGLSRPTFQRILQSARTKIAKALLEGLPIVIEGGNFMVKHRKFECAGCGHVWEVEPCSMGGKHGYEIACPKCNGMQKIKIEDGQRHACGGPNHGGGCCGNH